MRALLLLAAAAALLGRAEATATPSLAPTLAVTWAPVLATPQPTAEPPATEAECKRVCRRRSFKSHEREFCAAPTNLAGCACKSAGLACRPVFVKP